MRILYLSSFPDDYRPDVFIQVRKRSVLSEWKRRGHEVTVVAAKRGKYSIEDEVKRVFYYPRLYTEIGRGTFWRVERRLWQLGMIGPMHLIRLSRRIPVEKFDFVVCEGWVLAHAVLRSGIWQGPVGIRVYGVSTLQDIVDNPVARQIHPLSAMARYVINHRQSTVLVFNRSGSRGEDVYRALSRGGRPQLARFLILPNVLFDCVESKKASKANVSGHKPTVVQVGRMTKRHCFDLGVKVARWVVEREKARFVFVGDGPEYHRVWRSCRDLREKGVVIMAGRLTKPELQKVYCSADVAMNFYGYNPLIEAANGGCRLVSVEFGEIAAVMKELLDEKCFSVVRKKYPAIGVHRGEKAHVVAEVGAAVLRMMRRRDVRTKWKKRITLQRFAEEVVDIFERGMRLWEKQ